MKEIKLSKCTSPHSNLDKPKEDYSVQVDDEDYDYLNKFNWQYNKSKRGKQCVYAQRHGYLNGKQTTFRMHREIMGITDPKVHVDHIDHNTLNNQKSNLRLCTHTQNCQNTSARKGAASKYRGVTFRKNANKWVVMIIANKKKYWVGTFINEEDAAKAYDSKAKELYGQFANLNFKNG